MNSKKLLTGISLILATLVVAGCGKKQADGMKTYGSKHTPGDARAAAIAAHSGHGSQGGHVHTAPNGGELVELGTHQFNIEFRYDAARGMLRAWMLDAHAEDFVRVSMAAFEVQEDGGARRIVTLRATSNNLTGETAGDTSYFEGEAAWLGGIKHFDGIVKAVRVRDVDFRDVKFHFHP